MPTKNVESRHVSRVTENGENTQEGNGESQKLFRRENAALPAPICKYVIRRCGPLKLEGRN